MLSSIIGVIKGDITIVDLKRESFIIKITNIS